MDLDAYLSLSRLSGLALSPDGTKLVTTVATPDPTGKRFRSALWAIPIVDGEDDARQLTRSSEGETSPVFTSDGRLLFVSARPDPDIDDDADEAALWELPPVGEARLLLTLPAGVSGVTAARSAARLALTSSMFVSASSFDEDELLAHEREEGGVTAQLFTDYPIRFWDHWLGPREPVLLHAALADDELSPEQVLRGSELTEVDLDLTPDGSTVVATLRRSHEPDVRDRARDLVAIDLASGQRRTLLDDGHWYHMVAVSPGGDRVATVRERLGAPDEVADEQLVVVHLADGSHDAYVVEEPLWPWNPVWLPDGDAIIFDADQHGHHPLFRLDLASGEVTRLTAEGAYSDACVGPDGDTVYALRSTMDRPPHPVVLDATTPDQQPRELPSPATDVRGAGRVERLTATADDGVEIPSWIVLPEEASDDQPVPLVVFIHGGPFGSWNSWHWRWNPHLLAEHGYAVLLPDPALSTGYGQDFIERGWGAWGNRPYTDLMAAVDGALERPDLDDDAVAAMGGSFGGYMANWVAGHTDRFACIVTHASLWQLESYHGATDLGVLWEREFGDPYEDPSRFRANSPRASVDQITTPMLVIHGEKDFRVPISEALTLWTDLARHGVEAQFLYFPDENHWIAKPNHVKIWYRTVAAFLDHHLRGVEWERPELL